MTRGVRTGQIKDTRERRRGELVDFFGNSPLRAEVIEFERQRDYPREIDNLTAAQTSGDWPVSAARRIEGKA
jgi:hypothetical protein